MAYKNSREAGSFSFFKKKPAATKKKPAQTSSVQEETLEDVSSIAPLLVAILEEKLPVRLFLGNSSFPYYSSFEWELLEDSAGQIVESKEHLERGEYLLLAALDPPIGNIKIRSATEINVEFFTRFHLLNATVTLKQMTSARKLCLTFPESMKQKAQKRASFRAPIDRSAEITVSIIRPSGIAFGAKLADISSGGTAFYPTGATPRISDHSRIEMDITYPEGKVAVDAIILGTFPKEGEQYFRTQFLVASHKTASDIGALVAYVQRENSQKRIKTFQ